MRRRDFFAMAALASGAEGEQKTYVYKKAGGLEIKADAWGVEPGRRKPVAIYIHGGALIMGSRGGYPKTLQAPLLDAGFVFVSIDYRLAPETKLPGIIEDVQDFWKWLHKTGAKELNADTSRVVVAGGSAGGYLTLMTGYCVKPRPRALAAFWGYGDLIGDWYAKPDPFYSKQPAVPKDDAYGSVGHEAIAEPPAKNFRGRFYLYCRQHGLWPKEVGGHDPASEAAWFKRYCPAQNVTRAYPPTMLVHGTEDTDVPYEQSVIMDRELTRAGVKHEFVTVKGAGHGLSGIPREESAKYNVRAAEFLKRELGV